MKYLCAVFLVIVAAQPVWAGEPASQDEAKCQNFVEAAIEGRATMPPEVERTTGELNNEQIKMIVAHQGWCAAKAEIWKAYISKEGAKNGKPMD